MDTLVYMVPCVISAYSTLHGSGEVSTANQKGMFTHIGMHLFDNGRPTCYLNGQYIIDTALIGIISDVCPCNNIIMIKS